MKLVGKHENANDFFEAAQRCGWTRTKERTNNGQIPLLIPEIVNLSFACELYLKAIAEATNVDVRNKKKKKIHALNEIFDKLAKEDQKAIFDIWRDNAGENIPDCDYTKQMFFDNLEAVANAFVQFRYADEWAGSTVSLQSSFTLKQFEKLSLLSAQRPLGSPPIYDGFLTQFAITLKTYTEKLLGKTYNS